jgi:hypothetical protein
MLMKMDCPPSASSDGRPIGNKKAHAERNGASSLVGLDASIDKMVPYFSPDIKERDQRGTDM